MSQIIVLTCVKVQSPKNCRYHDCDKNGHKVKQMQSMSICILKNRWFEETFENTHWKKPNKCNQCDFASSYPGNLRTHLKTHGGKESNKCDQCNYTTFHKFNLTKHMGIHRGEKPNKCNFCGNSFSQVGNLKRHIALHGGMKSNKCDLCQYSSTRADCLGIHMKTHYITKSWNRINQKCPFDWLVVN